MAGIPRHQGRTEPKLGPSDRSDTSSDRPGAENTDTDAGGNIVEVMHQRIFGTASVRSPEVEFLVETRDREHTQALVRSLEAKGISVSVF